MQEGKSEVRQTSMFIKYACLHVSTLIGSSSRLLFEPSH